MHPGDPFLLPLILKEINYTKIHFPKKPIKFKYTSIGKNLYNFTIN